jgi:hypothetical protein
VGGCGGGGGMGCGVVVAWVGSCSVGSGVVGIWVTGILACAWMPTWVVQLQLWLLGQ